MILKVPPNSNHSGNPWWPGDSTFGEVAPHPAPTGQPKESFLMDNSQWQENGPLEVLYPGRITPEMYTEAGSTGSSMETSQGDQGKNQTTSAWSG